MRDGWEISNHKDESLWSWLEDIKTLCNKLSNTNLSEQSWL